MAQLTQHQETQTIAQKVVLADRNVRRADQENHPDENVSGNAGGKPVAVDSHRAVPEQGHQSPGEGPSNGGQVHQRWQGAVTPVGDMLIDKVGHEDDLRAPEVVAGPEQDPGEDEEVVQDEMRSDVGGGGHDCRVLME